MKRKYIIGVIILATLLSFSACGKAKTTPDPETNPTLTTAPTSKPEVTTEPTAVVTLTSTPIPSLTAEPEITDDPAPTEKPETTEEPTPTENPETTGEPGPTDAPEISADPTPTETPEVSKALTATEAPTATPAPAATKAPTATPAPTATKAPSATPKPTATPAPTSTPTPTPVPFVVPTGLNAAQVAAECEKLSADTDGVDKAVQIIVQNLIKPGMADHEKIKAIHDYIVIYTTYDYDNYINGTIPMNSYSPIGCLILHTCVCDGYAQAFQRLVSAAGIECYKVTGESIQTPVSLGGSFTGKTNHAWNIVKLEGEWYYVDTTWDDSAVRNENGIRVETNVPSYLYFLVPAEKMSNDHKDMSVNANITYSCSSYKYFDYYQEKFLKEVHPNAVKVENCDAAFDYIRNGFAGGQYNYDLYWEKEAGSLVPVYDKIFDFCSEMRGDENVKDANWSNIYSNNKYFAFTFDIDSWSEYIKTTYPDAVYVSSADEFYELIKNNYLTGVIKTTVLWDKSRVEYDYSVRWNLEKRVEAELQMALYYRESYAGKAIALIAEVLTIDEIRAKQKAEIQEAFPGGTEVNNYEELKNAIIEHCSAGEKEVLLYSYEQYFKESATHLWTEISQILEESGLAEKYELKYSSGGNYYYVWHILAL